MYKIKCDSWHKNRDVGLNFVGRLSFMALCLLFTRAILDFYGQSHPLWTSGLFHFFYDTNFLPSSFLSFRLVKFTFYSPKDKPVEYTKQGTSVELIPILELFLTCSRFYTMNMTLYVYIKIMYFKIGNNFKKNFRVIISESLFKIIFISFSKVQYID